MAPLIMTSAVLDLRRIRFDLLTVLCVSLAYARPR